MKPILAALTAGLLLSTTAIAASVPLTGTLSAAPVYSDYDDESASTMLSFQCKGDDGQAYGLCIDTSVMITRLQANLMMSAQIAPQYAQTYRRIKMTLAVTSGADENIVAHVTTVGNTIPVRIIASRFDPTVVTITSFDGGQTWSAPIAKIDSPTGEEFDAMMADGDADGGTVTP